jgi:hypothetical protein
MDFTKNAFLANRLRVSDVMVQHSRPDFQLPGSRSVRIKPSGPRAMLCESSLLPLASGRGSASHSRESIRRGPYRGVRFA